MISGQQRHHVDHVSTGVTAHLPDAGECFRWSREDVLGVCHDGSRIPRGTSVNYSSQSRFFMLITRYLDLVPRSRQSQLHAEDESNSEYMEVMHTL